MDEYRATQHTLSHYFLTYVCYELFTMEFVLENKTVYLVGLPIFTGGLIYEIILRAISNYYYISYKNYSEPYILHHSLL